MSVCKQDKKSQWIEGWEAALVSSGAVKIVDSLPGPHTECDWTHNKSLMERGQVFAVSLGDQPEEKDSFILDTTKYFVAESDYAMVQKAVLASHYAGSVGGLLGRKKTRIVVLNRSGSRHWVGGDTFVDVVRRSTWSNDVDVVHVQNLEGSLVQQAEALHGADILISPHGAQLTNLAFIRRCTVVVELFPQSYFLSFFSNLAVVAGAYSGYAADRSQFLDTSKCAPHDTCRGQARSVPIHASVASVFHALPRFICDFNQCRMNMLLKVAAQQTN